MTEPNRQDPVPAPARAEDEGTADETATDSAGENASFDYLEQRPVSEHVDVFEAEHGRLQRELGTIDQL